MTNIEKPIFGSPDFIDRTGWVCQCGHERCKPGHTYGPAVWDHYLLHYVVRGKGVLKKAAREYSVAAQQCFLIHPEETAVYSADTDEPWESYWVGFKGEAVPEILYGHGIDPEKPILQTEDDAAVREIFENMNRAYQTPAHSRYELMAYLYLLLGHLHYSTEPGRRRFGAADSYLEQAQRYIRDNYAYEINVEDVAAHVGIDRTYLYRVFMEHLSVSPANYLLRVRMERARQLLLSTELSVYEVALSSGYGDISHFSGAFKKYYGMPPSKCRRTQGEEAPQGSTITP